MKDDIRCFLKHASIMKSPNVYNLCCVWI